MRPEEPLGDIVGVLVMIHVLMVFAVVGAPIENGVFEGAGAEEQGGELDRGARFEGEVGEEAVVAEGDAQTCQDEHSEKEANLKPVESELPDVEGDGGDSESVDDSEENTRFPVNAFPGNAREERNVHKYVLMGKAAYRVVAEA